MGQIVTISSSKGGVGKTTMATALATSLAAQGYRVCVVDADINASFSAWHELYHGPAITCLREPRDSHIVERLQAEADRHDVVIADTAGFNNMTAAMAAGTADLVLVPIMPDRASVQEALATVHRVGQFAKASRREIPCRVVATRWNPKGLVERALVGELLGAGLASLRQHLAASSDVGKASMAGTAPTVGRLGHQADRLVDELIELGACPSRTEYAL